MKALLPSTEKERLAELYAYEILDTESEKAFDDIARLAAYLCDCPVALVTLIDEKRQWFKARTGIQVAEIDRDISFCTHTILQPELMQVPDTTRDPRFQESPLVTEPPHVRFYAGAPLVTRSGHAVGTLCVIDYTPRQLTPAQWEALENLSRVVVAQLDLRRVVAERDRALAERARNADALQERERQLQTITDNVPVLIARVDAQCRYLFANRTYQDFLRIPHEHVVGHTMAEVLGEEAAAQLQPYIQRVLAGEHVTFDIVVAFRTIGKRHAHASYVPEQTPEGVVTGFLISATDITESKQAEERLRTSEQRFKSLFEEVPSSVVCLDKAGQVTAANRATEHLVGFTAEEFAGSTDLPFVMPDERPHVRAVLTATLTGESQHYETQYRHKSGQSLQVDGWSAPIIVDGNSIGAYLLAWDVTNQKQMEVERERLLVVAVEQADHDPLTGLLNHRAFQKKFEEEANRAAHEGSSLAVAMLDLDNFKFFNDVYGHLAGDEVLRRVAASLQQHCRSYDTLARFGGDEFALLMPGLKAADAARLTRRVIDGLDGQGFIPPGHTIPIPLSLSAGVAVFPEEAPSRLEALAMADARLRLEKTGSDEAATAYRLRTEMTRQIEGFSMLDALVTAVDNKDRYTRRHSEDVMTYSLAIARELGLAETVQHTIAVGALLHDVGKIGVPDQILRKPGPLAEPEADVMKQHPMMGSIIVGAVPGFEETLDAIRHHHERWDGEGYPFGLRAEETPLIARLMAVADAFSAMTTDRPYRKGMDEAKALAILLAGAGTQWDPACVGTFLRTRS